MLRAARTTALCPGLKPLLLGDRRWEGERLAVTLEITASSTRGTTTTFHKRANHLNAVIKQKRGIGHHGHYKHEYVCEGFSVIQVLKWTTVKYSMVEGCETPVLDGYSTAEFNTTDLTHQLIINTFMR